MGIWNYEEQGGRSCGFTQFYAFSSLLKWTGSRIPCIYIPAHPMIHSLHIQQSYNSKNRFVNRRGNRLWQWAGKRTRTWSDLLFIKCKYLLKWAYNQLKFVSSLQSHYLKEYLLLCNCAHCHTFQVKSTIDVEILKWISVVLVVHVCCVSSTELWLSSSRPRCARASEHFLTYCTRYQHTQWGCKFWCCWYSILIVF